MFRFHVLCAHHLCEEEVTTFDPKMNNENLNKCLLSLKEFYRDLRLSQVSELKERGGVHLGVNLGGGVEIELALSHGGHNFHM